MFWDAKRGGHIDPPVQQGDAPAQRINEIGKLIEYWWREITRHFENAGVDEYVIMPDHVHGIIQIKNVGVDRCVDPLGKIVQWFKTMTTNEYIKNIKSNNWPRFHCRLWQRNYYERIIRNELEMNRIRKYIRENPLRLG